jgi:hypothetical protein
MFHDVFREQRHLGGEEGVLLVVGRLFVFDLVRLFTFLLLEFLNRLVGFDFRVNLRIEEITWLCLVVSFLSCVCLYFGECEAIHY